MENNANERLGILESMLRSRCSRQSITELSPDEVFVFGTDPNGNHKSSAAQLAVAKFGAKVGLAEGFYGQSYAIPVHKFKTEMMVESVNRFLDFAMNNPQLRFHVLPVGCGAAGMDPAFVALMFRKAIDIPNIFLCEQFIVELKRYYNIGVEISSDCKTIVRFPMKFKGEYIVPSGVECIGNSAFMGCCGCNLHLLDSIRRIEKWAFCDMGVLGRSLLIPKSVEFIDDKAFESEYFSPKMAVYYNSYAYRWARSHSHQYECVDFDEIADMKRRLNDVSCVINRNEGKEYYTIANPSLKKEDLIIGRHWVFVRTLDGRLKFVCGEATDEFILEVCGWHNVVSAAAGFDEVFAVLESGDVVEASTRKKDVLKHLSNEAYLRFSINSMFDQGYLDWVDTTKRWHGLKLIVACQGRVAGVLHNGTIISISDQGGYEKPENYDGELECRYGKEVVKLAVSWLHAAVLDVSGRVSVVGAGDCCNAGDVSDWRDIVDVDVFGCYYSCIQTVGLRSDGSVLHTLDCPEIDSWRDVVSVSCLGDSAVVALRKDGYIMLAGNDRRLNSHRGTIKEWPPLIAIRGNYDTLVGVDKDGRLWVSSK